MEMQNLIQQAANGNPNAFRQFVQQTLPTIYLAVSRRVRTEELAFDLTRECYISAWHSISLFQMDEEPLDWLNRIAENVCDRHLKRHPKDAAVGAVGENTPPETLLSAIMAAIEAEQPKRQWKSTLKRFRFTILALLLAAILLFIGSRMEQSKPRQEQTPAATSVVEATELVPAALEPGE